jgi:hypothetical protein
VEGSAIHDRQEYLTTNIHEHEPLPFVWISKVAYLSNGSTLTLVPSIIVCFAFEEGQNILMNSALGSAIHGLVHRWWDAIEARALTVLDLVDGCINL